MQMKNDKENYRILAEYRYELLLIGMEILIICFYWAKLWFIRAKAQYGKA